MEGVKLQLQSMGREIERRKAVALTIDVGEPPEKRMEKMIRENPVVVFSRRSCCMCHVIKRLLAMVGVHAMVIELEEAEADAASVVGIIPAKTMPTVGLPSLFIGGTLIGGLEGLMALHLSGKLVPRLQEVGALWA